MKISQELRTQPETNYARTNGEAARSFQKTLQSQTLHLKQQELQVLVKNISLQGDKLARFRTFRDLAKFKRLIKGFLQETVYSGLSLQKSTSFGMERANRQLAIVKEIDEKLIQLTEEIMNQEKKAVDLLGLIGEIKGLLVNLYT
ncbi:YaaR family protein [Virgibacillus proomii]|uniref:YaaR family protein n=1 Tax=Virgibacillus proomii TaxID=84407 RepID=UPI001C0F9C8B|nr:YaaR family protein [Virgibacillus proomii]MBU5266077.1 YaaR family protein [Virgibacillus proomii]